MIPDILAAYLDLNVKKYESAYQLLSHLSEYIKEVYGVRCGRRYIFNLIDKNKEQCSRSSQKNKISKYKTLNHFLDSIHLKSYYNDNKEYIFFVDKNATCFAIDIGVISFD